MDIVVVIAPSSIFRAGLVSLLGTMGFAETREADDIDALKRVQPQEAPQLLLVSLSGNVDSVVSAVREMSVLAPSARIVFLAEKLDIQLMSACFAAGASAYLLVSISREALCESLRLVATGEKVFPSELAALIPELSGMPGAPSVGAIAGGHKELSCREAEILQALTSGQSNKVIARNLDIAEATVKVHVKRILRKAHVSNRTQAALWAVSKGIARLPPGRQAAKAGLET